jgi:hypothetical protein
MNDPLIEELLRKSPTPQPPADLLQRLVADIHLPRPQSVGPERPPAGSVFRRWFPALTFSAFMLACFVVIGVQTNHISVLKQQNEALRAQTRNLDALRQANLEVQRLRDDNSNLARLQKDKVELESLGGEIARLQTQAAGLDQLRVDHQKLAAASRAAPGAPNDFFADAKAKAERISCVNNLKQVGLAIRIWANDNDGHCPPSFMSMTNELSTWRMLHCPGDDALSLTNWADVEAGRSS